MFTRQHLTLPVSNVSGPRSLERERSELRRWSSERAQRALQRGVFFFLTSERSERALQLFHFVDFHVLFGMF